MAAEVYEGPPCRRAGHTTRYVRGGNCVACSNDGRLKAHRWRREYGLTPEDVETLLARTGTGCPICGKTLSFTGKVASDRAVIDHDHLSGNVRSIICNGCNRGLGYFGDNPEALRAAAAYLETHATSP